MTKLQSTLYSKPVIVKKEQRLPAAQHRVLRVTAGSKRERDREAGKICKMTILIFNKYLGVIKNKRMV